MLTDQELFDAIVAGVQGATPHVRPGPSPYGDKNPKLLADLITALREIITANPKFRTDRLGEFAGWARSAMHVVPPLSTVGTAAQMTAEISERFRLLRNFDPRLAVFGDDALELIVINAEMVDDDAAFVLGRDDATRAD